MHMYRMYAMYYDLHKLPTQGSSFTDGTDRNKWKVTIFNDPQMLGSSSLTQQFSVYTASLEW